VEKFIQEARAQGGVAMPPVVQSGLGTVLKQVPYWLAGVGVGALFGLADIALPIPLLLVGGVILLVVVILTIKLKQKKKQLLSEAEYLKEQAIAKDHALVVALKDEVDTLYRQNIQWRQMVQVYQQIIVDLGGA